jgi:ActR/RegA family two-component response regulator
MTLDQIPGTGPVTELRLDVLLVEDDLLQAQLLHRLLDAVPYARLSLTHVPTLREAVARVQCAPWDVCLLDLGLPDSVGLASLRSLLGAKPDLSVVVLTGESDRWTALAAIKMGAQDFLVKDRLNYDSVLRSLQFARARRDAALPRTNGWDPAAVVAALPDGVIVLDGGGKVTYANPATERILDAAPGSLPGSEIDWLALVHDVDTCELQDRLGKVRRVRVRQARLPGGRGEIILTLADLGPR